MWSNYGKKAGLLFRRWICMALDFHSGTHCYVWLSEEMNHPAHLILENSSATVHKNWCGDYQSVPQIFGFPPTNTCVCIFEFCIWGYFLSPHCTPWKLLKTRWRRSTYFRRFQTVNAFKSWSVSLCLMYTPSNVCQIYFLGPKWVLCAVLDLVANRMRWKD